MNLRKACYLGVATIAGLTPHLRAQTTGLPAAIPAAPSAASAVAAPAAAPAAAAPGGTLWSFLGITPANMAACKARICASQIGQLLNSGSGVLGQFSGGLIPPLCPPPTEAQAAALSQQGGPTSAAAVAAKIKADEAQAKARVAAVEYLGTVDCHYWPDAADALVAALRTDRNECVRYAAAQVLNSGCCCTKKTVEALNITVSGSESDGNPAETSVRVMAAAFSALQNCLSRVPMVPEAPKPPERPEAPPRAPLPVRPEAPVLLETPDRSTAVPRALIKGEGGAVQLSAHYTTQLDNKSFAQVVNEARRTLYQVSAQRTQGPAILPTGSRSVLHAITKARVQQNASAPAPTPPYSPGVSQVGNVGRGVQLAATTNPTPTNPTMTNPTMTNPTPTNPTPTNPTRRQPLKDNAYTPASLNAEAAAPSYPPEKRSLLQIFTNSWAPPADRRQVPAEQPMP